MFSVGCAGGGKEPDFDPHVSLFDKTQKTFVDRNSVQVRCEHEQLKGYVLVSWESLTAMQNKFQQCARWK